MNYSIIDVETTGVLRNKDRIIEISIVKINDDGEIIDQYDTLINPKRDVGSIHVHGINPTMLISAPVFENIAETVLEVLNDSVIVAHNAMFDTGFLSKEFSRIGIDPLAFNTICTLELSRYLLPELPSRKLGVMCEYLNIPITSAHEAKSDAVATSKLFRILKHLHIASFGEEDFTSRYVESNINYFNIIPSGNRINFTRDNARAEINDGYLKIKNLLDRIPDFYSNTNYNISEYLNLIDKILEDRKITEEELVEIEEYANRYQIEPSTLVRVHEEYFRKLVRHYLNDQKLSDSEILDLEEVAKLLQIDEKERELIIQLEKTHIQSTNNEIHTNNLKGKSVCFTGSLLMRFQGVPISREIAIGLALENGLLIKNGVTKDLDILVVADPNTQSGKAQKAREYGTRIISELFFWKELGIPVE